MEGLAMKWNVSALRRSGECERTEVAYECRKRL